MADKEITFQIRCRNNSIAPEVHSHGNGFLCSQCHCPVCKDRVYDYNGTEDCHVCKARRAQLDESLPLFKAEDKAPYKWASCLWCVYCWNKLHPKR